MAPILQKMLKPLEKVNLSEKVKFFQDHSSFSFSFFLFNHLNLKELKKGYMKAIFFITKYNIFDPVYRSSGAGSSGIFEENI